MNHFTGQRANRLNLTSFEHFEETIDTHLKIKIDAESNIYQVMLNLEA